jgi:hypothetical protein
MTRKIKQYKLIRFGDRPNPGTVDCKDTAQKHHQFQLLTVLNQELTGLLCEARMLLPVQYLPPSKAWPLRIVLGGDN